MQPANINSPCSKQDLDHANHAALCPLGEPSKRRMKKKRTRQKKKTEGKERHVGRDKTSAGPLCEN